MTETLAQRARTWLTKEHPAMPEISKAHAGMQVKMHRDTSIDREDADCTLEILVEAYVELGGDPDDLLNSVIPTATPVTTACNASAAQLDCSMLVSYDDAHHTPLPTAQKLAAFAALKQSIGVAVHGACR